MNRETHDDLDDHEEEIQYNADDEGAVDLLEVHGMVMMAETMCVVMVVVVSVRM